MQAGSQRRECDSDWSADVQLVDSAPPLVYLPPTEFQLMTTGSSALSLQDRRTVAHVGPLVAFLLCLTIPDLMGLVGFDAGDETQPWYVTAPEQWLFPVQTILTLALLVCFRGHYEFRPFGGIGLAVLVGTFGIAIWITPGFLYRYFGMTDGVWKYLGFAERTDGFNPDVLANQGQLLYAAAVVMRFVRLVIVVPIAEEIFWRGFLMRYLIDPEGDFWKVPFGQYQKWSFILVTALFTLAHASVDYAAAVVFGSLIYWLAVRTKSLAACVVAHAVANLILGIYVMISGQWGYW